MRKTVRLLVAVCLAMTGLLLTPGWVSSQVGKEALGRCKEIAFSTEVDFVTQGPTPPDGNPIISDGDLLGPDGSICARNGDLLQEYDVNVDLGLDAVDVLSIDNYVVAFSTELDSPHGLQFTAGDLLVTTYYLVIRNTALTYKWPVNYDIGLDAVHFVGTEADIAAFLEDASQDGEIDATILDRLFQQHTGVDILFSTEGTFSPAAAAGFLDGDLLSARNGTVVAPNDALLDPTVPAGIPNRGVDFGLDAATTDRAGTVRRLHFSTEILYGGEVAFTDGDVLTYGNGVVATNADLVAPFEPRARMLGLDALSANTPEVTPCISKITKIGGVDVADIDPVDGTVDPLAISGINAPLPFGGRINIEGTICDDVDEFRVVYREAGTTDPWEGIDVPLSRDWRVAVDAFIPPWPDCLADMTWYSGSEGWYDGSDYRHLSDPMLGACNPGLSLTVWESTGVTDPDGLYEVMLVADNGTGIVSDTVRLVQLDNTAPVVNLDKQPGTCNSYTEADMPLMVQGRMLDAYFYRYTMSISGNGYGTYGYPSVAYYDDLTDNVIETGTVSWSSFVDLREVDVGDLAASPVECGYTVWITAWDRTVHCGFWYPANWASRCVGCRHASDTWTFEYSPVGP